MSTNFTDGTVVNNVLLATTEHFGFGTTGVEPATNSLRSRLINTVGVPAVAAPEGSIAMADTGAVFVNTNGLAGGWTAFGTGSADTNVIADPGTGVALPVGSSGSIALTVVAAGETNTLPLATQAGIRLNISCAALGGGDTRAITAAGAINAAGNTIMTFNAVTDTVSVQSMNVSGAFLWRVVFNDGTGLT
jgi:hypothetical protein